MSAALDPEQLAQLARAIARDQLGDLARLVAAEMAAAAPPPRSAHTTSSLAAELGVDERTIRRAITAGELAATRRCGRWVMAVEDVDAWLRSGKRRRASRSAPRARPTTAVSRGAAAMFAAAEKQ